MFDRAASRLEGSNVNHLYATNTSHDVNKHRRRKEGLRKLISVKTT